VDNVVFIERFVRRAVTRRPTGAEVRSGDTDFSVLREIIMWAEVGLEIAKVRPVASATRAKALEIRAIIRSQAGSDHAP
jgi:hypothetical protein